MNKKRGNIYTEITLVISIVVLIIITIYIINLITPFIWYEKLENIANKYVYVIEKYGFLTQDEENNFYNDLASEGFDTNLIEIDCPKSYLDYGTLFKFEIKYKLYQKYSILNNGIKNEERVVFLNIKKYSYSKI